MDDFVQWTDYQDIPSVKTAFFLHKETMKENYSLKKIIKELEKMKAEEEQIEITGTEKKESEGRRYEPEEENGRQEELWQQRTVEYDREEHDWIARQEMGSKILKETDNLWNPVKRLLHRHKRPKWGDWDGVYIDEEEL